MVRRRAAGKPAYVGSLAGRDFLNTNDYSKDDIAKILKAARDFRYVVLAVVVCVEEILAR